MAQDTRTQDELTKETELLEARRLRDKKEAEAIAAAAELAAARAAADPVLTERKRHAEEEKALLESEKENLALRKANSDALTAEYAADKAKIQAELGSVPDAPEGKGGIELKENAGKGEATLLAAIATRQAAKLIAKEVNFAGLGVTLVAGSARPLFDDWDQFDIGTKLIGEQLDQAATLYTTTTTNFKAEQGLLAQSERVSREFVTPLAVGTALESVAKIGQFFQTKYQVGGLMLEIDNELLLSAVADALKKGDNAPGSVSVLNFNPAARPAATILPTLIALGNKADDAIRNAEAADRYAAKLTAELETAATAAEKVKVQQGIAAYGRAAAACRAAVAAYQAFVARVLTVDDKGRLPISRIAEAKTVIDAISKGDSVLFVNMNSAVGGYYSRTSLWTFLGTIPYRVMGGAVISYTAVSSRGVVFSGVVPVHGGYQTIPGVKALVDNDMLDKKTIRQPIGRTRPKKP